MPAPDAFRPDLPVFNGLRDQADGRAWIEALPGMVADLEAEWELTTGSPYGTGVTSWVAPATTADGTPAVLKVTWPHREAIGEPHALRAWRGDGAVRLLRSDPDRSALLLERCEPGTMLVEAGLAPDDALRAAAGVLRRLWDHLPPEDAAFERLGDVTAEWADLARQRMERYQPPFDPGVVALGIELLEDLPGSATRTVVVHGDLNPGNLLAAEREPWLAIDPKPMLGDPGYDPEPLVLQVPPVDHADGDAFRHRFRVVADVVGEPADRLAAWAVARLVERALWWLSVTRSAEGSQAMVAAAAIARIAS